MARHPAPLNALRAEIRRLRDGGSKRIGVIGFSAGGHLAGVAALADDAAADEAVDFTVLGYAITSMETETYRPSRLILLEDATPSSRIDAWSRSITSASAPRPAGRRTTSRRWPTEPSPFSRRSIFNESIC